MKTTTIWLLLMTGLAIVLLGAAVLFASPDTAGKVLAIISIIVGSLVTVGTQLFKKNGGPDA